MRYAWPLLLLASCTDVSLPPIEMGPQLVPVEISLDQTFEAVMPSDLMVDGSGGYAVLDGYGGALHLVPADGSEKTVVRAEGFRGAVRGAADGVGGWWLAAPDADEVRHVDATGAVLDVWEVPGAVAVAEQGQELVVGLRLGGVMWFTPGQSPRRVLSQDVDGLEFGAIASVESTLGDEVLAVDTLGHRVHVLGPGEARGAFGRFGMWIGTLAKPKSATMVVGGVYAVADSGLGVVQIFDRDGASLGALGSQGKPARFEHPMDVVWTGTELLILDAATATVHRAPLAGSDIVAARGRAQVRHLRYPLIDEQTASRPAGEERVCRQCHDGVVNDDRQIWDASLYHHPVGIVPEIEVPAFFPVDEDGALRCGTCHSPHGASSLEDVKGVENEEGRHALVRHRGQDGDQFTRVSRMDADLCLGCHENAAHDQVLERMGLDGSAHPVGAELDAALAERTSGPAPGELPDGVSGSCLTCHTPHAATRKSLGRPEGAAETCLACHPDQTGPSSHPLAGLDPAPAEASELPMGPDGPTCLTCHSLVDGAKSGLMRAPADGKRLCVACHDSESPAGKHAHLKGRAGQTCLACHDVHQATAEPILAMVGIGESAKECQSCHKQGYDGTVGHPHGGADEIGCASCHTSAHKPTPPKACGECHEEQKAAASRGGHGDQSCQDCHAPHASPPKTAFAANPRSAPCLACHGAGGSAKPVVAWEHKARLFGTSSVRWEPTKGLALYDKQGQPVASGDGGELACQTCHTVHGDHADKPGDSLRRPGWQGPCGACHGDEALMLYRWFHSPDRRKGLTP
ncbi:MAG: putative CXXCH cytochrome family protein [Kiritimatiellia bacterium]|jgi:predicted CXXCH cytochrome family protein